MESERNGQKKKICMIALSKSIWYLYKVKIHALSLLA